MNFESNYMFIGIFGLSVFAIFILFTYIYIKRRYKLINN